MTDAPTITIPLERYERLRKDAVDAQLQAEQLRQELVAERGKTTEQRLTECLDLIEAFKTLVDHGVANLSPEFIRDIPAEALEVAAKHVARVMGASQRDSERAGVWAERAQLVYSWRDKRKARSWGEDVPSSFSSPLLPGEKVSLSKKRKPAKPAKAKKPAR